jgi:LytS/YehU family sensor histidine kinase
MTASTHSLVASRGWQAAAAPAAFWLAWAAARFAWHRSPWLCLTAQLWVAYAAAGVALKLLPRGRRSSWNHLGGVALAGACVGAALGLPFAFDFDAVRLLAPAWWAREGVLPVVFALAMHLPALFAQLREGARHAASVERARQAAAVAELSGQVSEARLKALQAQVEPHFLYNTLASAQYLVRHDPVLAETLLAHLHDWLRSALPQMRTPLSTLGREFGLARSYLAIMSLRLGGRLIADVRLPVALEALAFPPMMVATLVENAVKHGAETVTGPVRIRVEAAVVDGGLRVEVVDDGRGLADGGAASTGTGVGLANLRDRLAAMHGEAASLVVAAALPRGVRAVIHVPLRA